MDLSIVRLLEQYDFHTKLYQNCLEDIRPSDAQRRVTLDTNHIAWLAGNLVSVRYQLGKSIGLREQSKFDGIFKNQRPIQNHITYPDLVPIREEWLRITPILREKLLSLTKEDLLSDQPFDTPLLGKSNLLNTITFIIHRESYSIGQMGLLRKIFGYEAMQYN
ncbi:MAG: DinB family protein [Bacteroidota bacterium]